MQDWWGGYGQEPLKMGRGVTLFVIRYISPDYAIVSVACSINLWDFPCRIAEGIAHFGLVLQYFWSDWEQWCDSKATGTPNLSQPHGMFCMVPMTAPGLVGQWQVARGSAITRRIHLYGA